jgi:lipopolysaccharide cholinephosphotransferase
MNSYHKKLLFLLKELDQICIQNKVKYSLFAGTLIGAIRDKGFIPWDDDADIAFERHEYEKFIKIVPEDFEISHDLWIPRFRHASNPNVFIDILIFDIADTSPFFRKIHVLGLKFLQGTFKRKITTNKGVVGTFLSFITYVIGLVLTERFKISLYNKLAKSKEKMPSSFIFSSFDQFKYIGHVLTKDIFGSYHKIDFEDTQLMIMDGYDQYLREFYGDYMQLPPIELRVPEHGNFTPEINV